MKFTIRRESFQQGLAAVGASIPTRTTLPVLSNILLEANSDGVQMSGTDLDIAVSLRAPAQVEEAGSLTVPAKKLQDAPALHLVTPLDKTKRGRNSRTPMLIPSILEKRLPII